METDTPCKVTHEGLEVFRGTNFECYRFILRH